MKKSGILNAELADTVARLRHNELTVVSDAGLPVPAHVRRVDLAVTPGVPLVETVLSLLGTEIVAERILIAEEMVEHSPHVAKAVADAFAVVPLQPIEHKELLELLPNCKAVIRTGEFSPYANVVIDCGVAYGVK
jgi:D-ribose pyranase